MSTPPPLPPFSSRPIPPKQPPAVPFQPLTCPKPITLLRLLFQCLTAHSKSSSSYGPLKYFEVAFTNTNPKQVEYGRAYRFTPTGSSLSIHTEKSLGLLALILPADTYEGSIDTKMTLDEGWQQLCSEKNYLKTQFTIIVKIGAKRSVFGKDYFCIAKQGTELDCATNPKTAINVAQLIQTLWCGGSMRLPDKFAYRPARFYGDGEAKIIWKGVDLATVPTSLPGMKNKNTRSIRSSGNHRRPQRLPPRHKNSKEKVYTRVSKPIYHGATNKAKNRITMKLASR